MVEEKGLSLAAYARHRKISRQAVTKAVKRGRLMDSVQIVNGQPKIQDVVKADAEWLANSSRLPAGVHRQSETTRAMRPAQRWGILRMANGNIAVVLFNDAQAEHDREYEDQFIAAAQALSELPPVGADGYPDVYVEMTCHTARALAAALISKAHEV